MQAKTDTLDLRHQGKESFGVLSSRSPGLFLRPLGCRAALRSLQYMRPVIPSAPDEAWRLHEVLEEGCSIEIRCHTDANWVDFYLGFFEALTEFFGERAFILVKTLKGEFRIRLTFDPA